MKQFYVLSAITIVFLLSGCAPRYQVFDMLEMGEHIETESTEGQNAKDEVIATTYTQRILVDTETGNMYYFRTPSQFEKVSPAVHREPSKNKVRTTTRRRRKLDNTD